MGNVKMVNNICMNKYYLFWGVGGNVFVELDELVKYERILYGVIGFEFVIRGW